MREDATDAAKKDYLQPLMTLLQDAIALGQSRAPSQSPSATAAVEYDAARRKLELRLDTLIYSRPKDTDCNRINKRLVKHRFDLFHFLTVEGVAPDNNLGERDIRSVAAARADGGVNRTKPGATAFANIKSILRTCQKQGRQFLTYGLSLLGLDDQTKPLPLATATAINSS